MPDRHSGGNSVRVHNHIWNDSLYGKGQVLLSISNTASTFLTVSTSKLVADLRDLDRSHLYFDISPTVVICSQNYLVNIALLAVFERC